MPTNAARATNLSLRLALSLTVASALALIAPKCPAVDTPQSATDPVVIAHRQELRADPASPVLGDPHGDVTIVEFFDYACSYCKAVEPRLESVLNADGHIRLILKEFPVLTPESLVAARASLASMRQHKYQQFHDALMAYRGPWGEEAVFSTARNVGLNIDRLRRDMASPDIANELIANFNLARGLRIFQTPGFVVGDHVLTAPSAQIDFPAIVAATRRNPS